jgi:hypothetical protein
MTVTWRQQIVAYCVLLVARMFADDPQLAQDLKNLSNKITTAEVVKAPEMSGGSMTLDQLATRP